MKIYMLAFTLCAVAEAACWFIGAAWASQIVQLIIRLVYGMLMACVMLYSESDSLLRMRKNRECKSDQKPVRRFLSFSSDNNDKTEWYN